jgi:ABC-type sugar transport system ATPase subunit
VPAGIVTGEGGAPALQLAGGTVGLPRLPRAAALPATVVAGIRPEALTLQSDGALAASTTIVEMLGAEVHVIAAMADGTRLVIRQDARLPVPARGEPVRIAVTEPGSVTLFSAESGERLETG